MEKKYFVKSLFGCLLICVLSSFAAKAQLQTITGKVVDADMLTPLQGVTIKVAGGGQAASTNNLGEYSIEAKTGDLLRFNFLGYDPVEIVVGKESAYDVKLIRSTESLDSVVVVGYGTQRKRDITGSVTSLSPQDLQPGPAASFDQMMQGKVAGAQITQTTGAPGGNVNIVIRGINSITGGNQPLYVIDGYAIGAGGSGSDVSSFNGNSYSSEGMANNTASKINPLSSINPSDIASIEILKDASATAIYGSRGANGVVLITTRRGKEGKAQISFEASAGLQTIANKIDMLDARQFAEFVADGRDNAWVYAGGNASDANEIRSGATQVKPEFRNPGAITTNTDWQDVIFRPAAIQNYQLSASGGSED